MNTVTLGVKMNNIPFHAVLDSGAGCSVIDLGSVEKLGVSQIIILMLQEIPWILLGQ